MSAQFGKRPAEFLPYEAVGTPLLRSLLTIRFAVGLQSGSQLAYNPVRSWLTIRFAVGLQSGSQLASHPVRCWQLAKFVIAYFFLTNPNP